MRRFITLLAVAAGLAVGFGLHTPVVHAADCDDNSIIKCGFSGSTVHAANQDFISKVKANDSLNGHHDLISVYKGYGFDSSKYDDFVSYARRGTAYKNGKIIVDGRVVATDANSIGRLKSYQGSGPFRKVIDGNTYWGNSSDQAFLTDGLPVTVLFDDKGAALFAVLNSCGNPMGFTPVKTTYGCTNLKSTPVSGQPGKFGFKTNATAGNGAKIEKLVYNFGDGTTATSYNVNETVYHTFSNSQSYHVTVKISVSLPFGHSDIINGADTGCDTVVKVQLPFYACLSLKALQVPDKKFTYQFIVKSKTLYGASLKGATFSFGDGSKTVYVARANVDTASIVHAFEAGKYNVTATLTINLPDNKTTTVTSGTCATTIKAAEYGCLQLSVDQPDDTMPLAYSFTAAGTATPNLVTYKSADFDFGDGNSVTGIVPSQLQATTNHTYAADGDYTITATLHFTVNGVVQSDKCTAAISKTPVSECRPGVPSGSVLCTPCQYNNQLPPDSTECVAPVTTLPNTGAGDVIAISGVVALIGFFFYRQFIFRKHVFVTDNGTINMLLGETTKHHHAVKHEMAHHNAQHRNKQALSHATYRRPHRFRPRSHDK